MCTSISRGLCRVYQWQVSDTCTLPAQLSDGAAQDSQPTYECGYCGTLKSSQAAGSDGKGKPPAMAEMRHVLALWSSHHDHLAYSCVLMLVVVVRTGWVHLCPICRHQWVFVPSIVSELMLPMDAFLSHRSLHGVLPSCCAALTCDHAAVRPSPVTMLPGEEKCLASEMCHMPLPGVRIRCPCGAKYGDKVLPHACYRQPLACMGPQLRP